jgi:hypothetical protein
MKLVFDHSKGYVIDEQVFCEVYCLPENETPDELLELGWLPTSLSDIPYWYQSQSCRINSQKVYLSYKKRKIISLLDFEIFDYNHIKNEVDEFFYDYIEKKMFDSKKNYDFYSKTTDLSVMRIKYDNKVVGYVRFKIFNDSILLFDVSYDLMFSKLSLGICSFLMVSKYGKTIDKNYVYIFEAYKNHFSYKLKISGVECFEGEKWISPDI